MQKANSNDKIVTMDITNKWTKKHKTGSVKEKLSYLINGTNYVVDGKHIFLQPTEKEKSIATVLAERYGKAVEHIPQVVFPQGIQTPDYLVDGERFDLKSTTGSGKNLIYGLIAKKRKQSDNFIIDISDCPLNMEEVEAQVESLYTSPRLGFLRKIVLMKNSEVIKVYDRK